MRVEKIKMADLTLCYCVSVLQVNGKRCFAVASEKEYACLLFDEHGHYMETIWEGPGGTMSAVQVPGADGVFLATQRFYSPNNCKEAAIVLCYRTDDGWRVRTLAELPGVHRFDILNRNGINYLIACTIKSDYEYKDDWRFPGKVFACTLPDDLLTKPEEYRLPLEPIYDGLVKNHGYSRHTSCGFVSSVVTSNEGIFIITPPASAGEKWLIKKLLSEPTSDALLLDFDGDGIEEILTISPFHGEKLRIFKCGEEGFRQVYECEKELPFLHAICPATLNGKPFAVIGYRRGDRDLLAVSYQDGAYRIEVLDHDIGPTNALSYELDGQTVVISANREINEVARYVLSD